MIYTANIWHACYEYKLLLYENFWSKNVANEIDENYCILNT